MAGNTNVLIAFKKSKFIVPFIIIFVFLFVNEHLTVLHFMTENVLYYM